METTFEKEAAEVRAEFVEVLTRQEWNNELLTKAGTLLIMYDQMVQKQRLEDTISFLESRAEKAENETYKWNDGVTTYGDTRHLAAAVNFGRKEAFDEAINSIHSAIK